jgi:hypothetical protein
MPAATRVDSHSRAAVDNLSGTVDNLTRTWLRLQNEVSRLASSAQESASIPAQVSALAAQLQAREAVSTDAQNKISALEARLRTVEQQWQEDIDGRGRRVDDTLRLLLNRVEFVRRELLFELRYGAGDKAPPYMPHREVRSRILVPAKVEGARASGALRLNIGCGHVPEPDFINVDMRELPNVDVLAEATALPFDTGSVDEIYSAHLVEHFPQEELRCRLLLHWRDLLKPGGRLRAITLDGEAMLAGVAQGLFSFENFREVLFGSQDHKGDFPYNLLTPDGFRRIVEEAGFVDIGIPVRGRRNGRCFEFELTARLPPIDGRSIESK